MGIDPVAFDWVSAPEPETIKAAAEELIIMGAIDKVDKAPTELGNLISFSQQEPKTVRMIYTGMLKGSGVVAIKIAALLSVSKLFFLTGGKDADHETRTKLLDKRKELQHEDGDVITMLKLYLEYEALDEDENEVKPGQKLKEIRSKWLENNALSKRAINMARSTVRDLYFIFTKTELWTSVDTQELVPDDEDVLRLFCAGYFLHAARRVNDKGNGPGRLSYCALEAEVVGHLPAKSSLVQTSKDEDGDVKNEKIPDWILFDQILKYPDSTVFPLSSRIKFGWIQNESDEFYKKCVAKENKLPTEVVEIKESEAVLRTLFGRRLVFLPRFEEELRCSLVADVYMGSLRAFCSVMSVTYVKLYLKTQIERVKVIINNERHEQTWMANTRLVIGPGYQLSEILFSGEYDVIHIRNLKKDCTYEQLENLVYSKIENEKVLSVRLVLQETACMGVVRLAKSADAAELLNSLKASEIDIGTKVNIVPALGNVNSGSIRKGEEVRVKISWPLGYATGEATFFFETARDGNRAIDLIRSSFGPRTIVNAFGDRDRQRDREYDGRLRVNFGRDRDYEEYDYLYDDDWVEGGKRGRQNFKAAKVYVQYGIMRNDKKYKFIENEIYFYEPDFKVRAKGLPGTVDEFQLINLLKPKSITPLRVYITRESYMIMNKDFLLTKEEIEEKLVPFCKVMEANKNTVVNVNVEKANRRGVLYVSHPDTVAVEKAQKDLQKEYLKLSEYGQPHRVLLERTYTFSVHTDLYQCLRKEFEKVVSRIKKRNIWVIESGTGNKKDGQVEWKSKFVYIKFRHTDPDVVAQCRRQLETVLRRDVFDAQSSPNIANLFTWTGRLMINEQIPSPDEFYYIHWDNINQRAYIYGRDAYIRRDIKIRLNQIIKRIEKWKKAGLFEVVVMLNRRALEDAQKKDKKVVDTLCQKFQFVQCQYRLVGRNKLIISSSNKEKFERFKKHLESKGLLMSERKKNSTVLRECNLCFSEIDQNFIVTSLCNHEFCMVCIQHMFKGVLEGAGVQSIPLRCPADKCERILPHQDLQKILPPQVIPKLIEIALDMYLRTEDGLNFKYCPKPGCNQVFKPKIETEGSNFYSCDSCLSNFCLDCTEFLGKEIPPHPGVLCKNMRACEDDRVRKVMNQIRDEILCLRCPRCKTPFYDYSGCAALSCETCNAAFCALCVKDCGRDAHPHVLNCKYNNTTSYFIKLDVVNNANRVYRIRRLSRFFRDSIEIQQWGNSDSEFITKLLGALTRDLTDLGINITDIKNVPLVNKLNEPNGDELQQLVINVRDEIIILRCRNCKTAFNDNIGEATVTCSGCEAEFCSLCLKDLGTDPRSHLMNCRYNETGDLFVNLIIVKKARRLLRISKLSKLIQNSTDIPDLKTKLVDALAQDLGGLEINVTDF